MIGKMLNIVSLSQKSAHTRRWESQVTFQNISGASQQNRVAANVLNTFSRVETCFKTEKTPPKKTYNGFGRR